jgi:NDP-sugar pyrophosphorylase family protein
MAEPQIPVLFLSLPDEFAGQYDLASPWSLLGKPFEQVLLALPSEAIEIALDPDSHLYGDRIVVGRGTRIHPGAVVEGPVRIGRDVQIRPGAYIRGGCWIGDGCIVGASTEIKHSILLDGARAPHLNYVGDSILGAGVNLGAGTIVSNFRHDGLQIEIPTVAGRLPTGRHKLGGVLGDRVLTGCNCVLHPGVVIGSHSELYPGVQLRSGIYPANTIVKLRQELELVEKSK